MITFSEYIISTGQIIGHGFTNSDTVIVDDGCAYIEAKHDADTKYIVNGEIADRPTMTVSQSKQEVVADSVDSVIITGIPSGATIRWNATEQTADGNDIEFVTDIIGEHKLHITLWPYQDAEVTINAI